MIKTTSQNWISINAQPSPNRHATVHSIIVVPKRPNIRCHRFPFPASAFWASFSRTLTPYCLIQHINGLFFALTSCLLSSFELFATFSSICGRILRLISSRTGGFGVAAGYSSSLSSAFGWPIGLRMGDDMELMVSRLESEMSSGGRVLDFVSSRSPHSLQSWSLRVWSSFLFFRRLAIVSWVHKNNMGTAMFLGVRWEEGRTGTYSSVWSSASMLRRPWADIWLTSNHIRSGFVPVSSTWRANLHSHLGTPLLFSSSSL